MNGISGGRAMRRSLIVASWSIAMILSCLVVAPALAATTTRQVAIAGVDAGDCAQPSAPCRTISYALTQAATGDTIVVGPGEYAEQVRVPFDGITIEGAGPAATTVIGTPCIGNWTFLVVASDVTLRNLGVAGCPEGVVVGVAGSHVIVEGDLFLDTTDVGVSLAGGSATVLDSVFRGRTGVADRSPGSMVVVGNTFLTHEAAIAVNQADATVHQNRITALPNIGVEVAATGTADLKDNWWGCNGGPNTPGCATLVGKTSSIGGSWLQLHAIGAPTTVPPGTTLGVTFGLLGSTSGKIATKFPAAPVAFSTTTGSVDPDGASTINGVATTSFMAPSEAGTYKVTAGLDGGRASVTFNAPNAPRPTGPPTSILAGRDEGDRGGLAFLVAVALLSMSAWLVRRDRIRQRR